MIDISLQKLMDQPKWFQSIRDIKICDAVFFIKRDGHLVNTYKYGMIHQLGQSKCDLIGEVVVKYRNHNESVTRFTNRAVCEVVLIHPTDELHLMEKLGNIASANSVGVNVNKQKCVLIACCSNTLLQ